jgi:hypothetical protein
MLREWYVDWIWVAGVAILAIGYSVIVCVGVVKIRE